AFLPVVFILLAASQLLAAQTYDWNENQNQHQNPFQNPYPNQYQNRASQLQGQQHYPSGQHHFNQQDVQIGPRSGVGQDTQKPIRDPQIDVVEMGRAPAPAPVAATRPPATTNYMDRFSSKLFQKIATGGARRNMVYSPISVHAMMCLIAGASEGKTLLELQEVGEFSDKMAAAVDFKDLIDYKKGLGNAELTMATKVYYNRQLGGINPSFTPYSEFYFRAGIQPVDMNQGKDSADQINAWVKDQTRGKIQNLISSSDLDSQTQALLVNAIYFRGLWENEFATMDTLSHQFQHSDGSSSNVAMMYNEGPYGLADIPQLDASVLELAYKNSGTSMFILLPKQRNGLAYLESQLARREFDLNKIASRVQNQTVTVRIPKFQFEFEQDMTVPLKELGVRQMFTPQAQIVKMLDRKVQVEKILQKAFIDVNEAGTEAAATTFAKFVPLSLPQKTPEFTADHPFVFAIRTASSVLFMGRVEHPTLMAP
ncbi:hypothetical protein KR059_012797, partial [Drosophila kikkawai]